MSYYNAMSRPMSYDPSLAKRTQINELSASDRKNTMKQELGFSDSEESYSSDDESKSETAMSVSGEISKEEFEQLRHRYLVAMKETATIAERERESYEKLAQVRQISKSQVTFLNRTFKAKLQEQQEMLREVLEKLQAREAGLDADQAVSQHYFDLLESQKEETNKISCDTVTAPESLPAQEEIGVYKQQIDSLNEENAMLRRAITDLNSTEEAPETFSKPRITHVARSSSESVSQEEAKASSTASLPRPTSEASPAGEVVALDVHTAAIDRLEAKVNKSVKLIKSANARVETLEMEKAELLGLLTETRDELSSVRSNAAAVAVAVAATPPVAPAVVYKEDREAQAKLEKSIEDLKAKLEKSKKAATEATNKSKSLEQQVATSTATIAALESQLATAAASSEYKEKIASLEKSLKKERENSASLKHRFANASENSKTLANSMAQLKAECQQERKSLSQIKTMMEQQIASMKTEVTQVTHKLLSKLAHGEKARAAVVAKYEREHKERRRLFNLVQELRGNIRVICRSRPALAFEQSETIVKFPEQDSIKLKSTKGREKTWEFDAVIPPNKNNTQVFAEVADLCTSILDGYNVCIFAYGQTGSGKTHTMEGNPDDRGVNYRALQKLFDDMKHRNGQNEWKYDVKVSLSEIYNEQILDLLADRNANKKKLEIKRGERGMHIPGMTMVEVQDHEQVVRLMALGHKNRSVATTDMNEHSSRSHCILSVYIEGHNLLTHQITFGKMHLIDLAGSERIDKSGVKGAQLTEATNINKSLSALGDVIQARANKQGHVPYRNSTLTYMLQDSLEGDSKTVMFVQVSPVLSNADESFCSLNFASRVRTVELGKATRHVGADK